MQITIADLKTNTSKFVMMAKEKDIFITKNGNVIAKLVNAKTDKVDAVNELLTMFPKGVDIDLDKLREERILGR